MHQDRSGHLLMLVSYLDCGPLDHWGSIVGPNFVSVRDHSLFILQSCAEETLLCFCNIRCCETNGILKCICLYDDRYKRDS